MNTIERIVHERDSEWREAVRSAPLEKKREVRGRLEMQIIRDRERYAFLTAEIERAEALSWKRTA